MSRDFYDRLAPYYHLLYGDWEAAMARQGQALTGLLCRLGVAPGAPVLDAACGIGTQTLGLMQAGYQVRASDLSPGAVARLNQEADARGLRLAAAAEVDDLRHLSQTPPGSQAAVLACDNSLPHLLTDEDLLQALRSLWRCLAPGGWVVISVRDYAATPRIHPDVRPYGLREQQGQRFLAVQVWEWDGDTHYDLRVYLTTEAPSGQCHTEVLRSRYYAVAIDRLMDLMREAGFTAVSRDDGVLFQPVLIGKQERQGAAAVDRGSEGLQEAGRSPGPSGAVPG